MNKLEQYLRDHLSFRQKSRLRNIRDYLPATAAAGNLDKLGRIYKTDKTGSHGYTTHYATHFKHLRKKRINLLEIGVGGYDDPLQGANSLRMWKRYFPHGKIFSIDIHDKSQLQEKRIKIYRGSQVDRQFLEEVSKDIGEIDLIVDDGSHINSHVIETFTFLFPKLKDGGIYVVEDTQTSYWEHYGGSSKNLDDPATMMNFFKKLSDSLNHREFVIPGYRSSYFDRKIVSMHFYHNMVFVYKGDNDEPSNIITRNRWPEGLVYKENQLKPADWG